MRSPYSAYINRVEKTYGDWRATSPQSNLRRARRNGLIGYNGTPQIHHQNCPSPSTITTPSNTPIPRPTPFTIPNGIRIQSAVLPQYTFRTDRQTDRQCRENEVLVSTTSVQTLSQHRTLLYHYTRAWTVENAQICFEFLLCNTCEVLINPSFGMHMYTATQKSSHLWLGIHCDLQRK